ncbi:MAG TPA: ATP-binding protein [Gammaproteobacteria bacterium]|nr:ATP-binding protein [Gammaproteobacteria bacterium]
MRPVNVAIAPTSGSDWLQGGGEMGARVRALEWSATPLGPIGDWPQSLRSPLSMMLASKAQIILFWGPEYVVFYNDAYRPVFGAKHPNMLGMPGRVAWSEIWDSGANLRGLLDGVVRTGEAFSARDLLFVLERYGFDEETYFDVSYDPVRDESGAIAGVFCIVTETTGRVVGERRLELLKDLAAQNSAARTLRGVCLAAMETLAAKRQDIVFALAYLDGELQACTPGAEAALAAATEQEAAELPFPSGKLIVGLNPRRPFDDLYRSFVGLVADQVAAAVANARAYEEERKRAEALAEIDRVKTAFFSNVSHEFRTPLTLMLGPLEDLLANAHGPLPTGVGAAVTLAHRNSLRLLKLVNSLLDFARIESGRAEACYEPTDLARETADLASVFRSAIERAALRLVVECEPLAEPVYVDRDMWEKIVLNLLSNAFKFTFEGEIRVALCKRGDWAELRVSDTGVGIPEAEMPKLFQRFQRVRNTRSRTHEGSGIGLALVRELVKLHGGEIAVESREHVGTTFIVRMPQGCAHLPAERVGAARQLASTRVGGRAFVEEALRSLPATDADPDPTVEVQVPQTARKRLLLADDNADMRDYVRGLLERHYDVVAVGDGQEALDAIRECMPDLVLTDVMMPRLDGFGLLAALRAEARTQSLPVIMLSARAGEDAQLEGLAAGVDDYLIKPFGARELLARVGSHLALALQRSRLEQALRYRSEQVETLLECAPLGIYLIGPDFRIRAVNPVARLTFGDVPGGLEGRDFDEVMHIIREASYADQIVRIFRHTLATGEPYFTREQAVIRPDRGAPEHYEWRLERITLPDGERGLVCYFRDISSHVAARTAVEESREALKDADRRKDEFLATLAHELRTPLAPIHNALEILRISGREGAVARSVYEMMGRQVNHMVRLVDDLMEVSRITRGKIDLQKQRVGLAAVVGNAVETTRPLLDAAGHLLTVDLGGEPLELDADPVRLAQVFGNLLNNAAKYTPNGGQITLRAEQRGAHVVVSVRDNGAGIRADVLDHVFDPFVQGERSYSRSKGGLGIGLTLARSIVVLHGGTIEARSAGLGAGSEFVVRLPLPPLSAVSPSIEARRPATRIAGQRILVVDDNIDAAESLGALLRCLGADVVTVHDGPAALEALRTERPSAAVLDIGMPGMDGYEVARRVRSGPRGNDIKLIALTGWGNDEDRRRSREAGIDHHLVKPVDVHVLEDVLAARRDESRPVTPY